MLISVIVPAYCSRATIEGFLASISEQQCDRSSFEIILINDCSPFDWSAKDFSSFGEGLGYAKFVFLDNQQNFGRSVTRNRGVSCAAGEYFLFLDVDNYPASDAFHCILEKIEEMQRPFCGRLNIRQADKKSNIGFVSYFDRRYLGARGVKDGDRLTYRYFASDGLLIPSEVFKEVGGFDSRFKYYGCEDEELGIRVSKLADVPFIFMEYARATDSDSPTLDRAVERMVDYSKFSAPLMFQIHPEIRTQGLFGLAERFDYIAIYFPLIEACAHMLKLIESKYIARTRQPPDFVYKAILGLAYLKGMRERV